MILHVTAADDAARPSAPSCSGLSRRRHHHRHRSADQPGGVRVDGRRHGDARARRRPRRGVPLRMALRQPSWPPRCSRTVLGGRWWDRGRPTGPDARGTLLFGLGLLVAGHGHRRCPAAHRACAAGPRRGHAGRGHVRADRRRLPGAAAAGRLRADLLGWVLPVVARAAGAGLRDRDPVVALGVPRAGAARAARGGAGRPGRAPGSEPPRPGTAGRPARRGGAPRWVPPPVSPR